ncbi:MAG TPA: aminopeptidase, partial [Aquifex aeolicus]|nr:aminopeptidase [Aquifex aeolicus]
MEVKAYKDDIKKFKGKSIALLVYEETTKTVGRLSKGLANRVKKVLQVENFKGKEGEIIKVPTV